MATDTLSADSKEATVANDDADATDSVDETDAADAADTADATDTTDAADTDATADSAGTVEVKRRGTAVRSAPGKRRGTGSDGGARPPRTASTASAGQAPGRRLTLLVAAVMALLVAATGFFGYHYFTGSDRSDNPETRAQVVSVANDYAVKLSSFDYRDLNKNRKSITAMSTADFGKKYDEMVKALTEIVSNGQGVATAEVTNSAVESLDGDKATVILFVNQKARNVVAPDGKNQPYRMVVKLVRTDGTWLVDDVQTV